MSNRKATKRALLTSVMALVMCVVMLVGTTFAWFTDTASTGVNKIQAGNLKVSLVDDDGNDLTNKTIRWTRKAASGKGTEIIDENGLPLWEPGATYGTEWFNIKNDGNLALKYKVSVNGFEGDTALLDVLDFSFLLSGDTIPGGMMVIKSLDEFKNYEGHLLPASEGISAGNVTTNPEIVSIRITAKMKEEAGNKYQGMSLDGIGITVAATQYTYEKDSISSDYDKDATYPVVSATGLKDALVEGGSLVLGSDVKIAPEIADKTVSTLVPQMTVSKDTVLDLSDKEIGVDASDDFGNASPVLMAVTGGTLTLNGEGTINCEAGEQQVYGINVNGGKVVINGGEYYGAITAVQVQKGSLVINGGFFDMAPTCKAQVPQYAKYVVNCIDASFKDGSATISITGGTFVNFDPSANPEGANTTYVADGYKVVSEAQTNGDVWYTVVKA